MLASLAALLPHRLRRSLVYVLLRDLERRGDFQVHTDLSIASPERVVERLRALGITRAIDIGAYKGDWTKQFKQWFPDAAVLMIEALPDRAEDLRRLAEGTPGVGFCPALLGDAHRDGVPFFRAESGSSLLRDLASDAADAVTLQMRRLDDVAPLCGTGPVDLIKLDVQGAELRVLAGAPRTLAAAKAVLMEVSLVPLYEDTPTMEQVLSFMRARGFVPADIWSMIRRPADGALVQVDLLFVRDSLVEPGWQDAPQPTTRQHRRPIRLRRSVVPALVLLALLALMVLMILWVVPLAGFATDVDYLG